MQAAPFFPDGWHFDWRSAVIGAVVAWALTFILYRYRDSLRQLGERLWAPVVRWRTRFQRSTEEKYLLALRKRLRTLLLFEPEHPETIFVPPLLLAPPPLPDTFTETFDADTKLHVNYSQLLKGHPRVLLTGHRGTGRTTALVTTLWHLISPPDMTAGTPFTHFPLWIDLSTWAEIPSEEIEEADAVTWLTQLATQFFPQVRPKWLTKQLQKQPALILVDNWEKVPSDARSHVAEQIEAAADRLPKSVWMIATNLGGYGPLVEAGFVPLDLRPSVDQHAVHTLYKGWTTQLKNIPPPLENAIEDVLLWALEAGDDLVDLTLRIWVYHQTGETPYRMQDVLELCVEQMLPLPDLGEGEEAEEMAHEARSNAKALLQTLAWREHTDAPTLSLQEIKETLLAERLPPEEERPAQLENRTLRLLRETPFLEWQQKVAAFRHPVWQDIWMAHRLTETEETDLLRDHLQDPNWSRILETYIGMAPAQVLVATLLKTGLVKDELRVLLKSARWTILAPDDVVWRKFVMKALAKAFAKSKFTLDERLMLGKALALVAEEDTRPFFLQVLRHPEATVRAAAYRGLGWTGQPRDVQILGAGLNDEDFEVQRSAVHGLGDLGTPGAYRLLKDRLAEVDERLMLVIAETLAKDPQGWEALKEALKTPDLLVRRSAVHGLGQIEADWTEEILDRIIREDTQWLVKSAAEAALESKKIAVDVRTVQPPPRIDEATWLITWAAQEGLGVGLGEAAFKMLLRALEAGDAQARFLACVTLGRIGKIDHLSVLTSRLEVEENARVRKMAEEAKRRIENRYRDVEVAPAEKVDAT